jgi:predicted acyltransferase
MASTFAPPVTARRPPSRRTPGRPAPAASVSTPPGARGGVPPGDRLVALDVFRGITMAFMVIVNNGGDGAHVYAPLRHAAWHGWTPTDLVFPFFLFIVGTAMTMSRKTSSWASIAKRALMLLGIALFLSAFPLFNIATLRWPGVLQRIAVCYFAAAVFVKWRGSAVVGARSAPNAANALSEPNEQSAKRLARDTIIAIAVLLIGYWAVMMFVPGSTGIAGDLTQEGNVAARVDRALMAGHIYRPLYDPEGLLSTVPAIATTLMGVLVGLLLRTRRSVTWKSATLAIAGVALVAAGLLWDQSFPINKALWTSSYVLFAGGAAALTLAACLWLIDARGWRSWTRPFVILGRNALALFVMSALLAKTLNAIHVPAAAGAAGAGPAAGNAGAGITLKAWIYHAMFEPLAAPINASLLYAIANLVVLFVVLWLMSRRGWYWRV